MDTHAHTDTGTRSQGEAGGHRETEKMSKRILMIGPGETPMFEKNDDKKHDFSFNASE